MTEIIIPPTENQSRTTKVSWIQFLGKGIARSLPILSFTIVIPNLVGILLETGLKNLGIVAAGAAFLVLLLISFIIGRLTAHGRAILGIVSMFLTGGFALLAGLQLQFGINRENPLNIALICIVLVSSFIAGFADLSINLMKVDLQPEPRQKFGTPWEAVGLFAPLAGLGILYLLTTSITYVFFGIGIFFLLLPPFWFRFNEQDTGENLDAPKKVRRSLAGQIFTRLFAWGLVLAVFTAGAFTEEPTTGLAWCILGIGGGVLLHKIIPRKGNPPVSLIAMLGLIVCFVFIYQYPLEISSWGMMILLGLLAGYLFGAIDRDLRSFPRQKRKNMGLWGILWILLIIGSLYVGREIQYEIEHGSDLWWGFLVFGCVSVLTLVIERTASKKWHLFTTSTPQKPVNRDKIARTPLITNKRRFLALSLCFLVAAPSITYILYLNSHSVVWIDLPTTMYSVDGTAVTRVELQAKTAKILLYSPQPTGVAHDETIRLRKSIRLGAYFYGMGDTTVGEAVQWIGNNLDVYSLGMCGYEFSPDNISAMRALNPQAKFYYMSFATTLYENASSTFPDGTWGNTQYPYLKFNDSMNEWTLKLRNGTEATGVRRGSEANAHLMDLGKSEWADYFAWIYTRRAAEYHADGVAIDEVMWNGYWDTEISELRDYTSIDQIKATCYSWLARLDSQTNMEIITQAYWPAAQVHQNGTWGEISFRSGGQYGDRVDDQNATVWYESMAWKQIIEDMETQAAQNKSYIWAAWYEQNSTDALEYAIASYLMGKPNNNTKIAFHPQPIYNGGYPANLAGYSVQTVQEEVAAHPEYYGLEMGDATGPMFEVQGNGGRVWQRNFTNGIVLVNPNHAFLPGFD